MSDFEDSLAASNARKQAVSWLALFDFPVTESNIAGAVAIDFMSPELVADPKVRAAFTLGSDVELIRQAVIDAGGPDILG